MVSSLQLRDVFCITTRDNHRQQPHKSTQIADRQMWNLIRDSQHPDIVPRKCSVASDSSGLISIKTCRAGQISSAPPALGGAISGPVAPEVPLIFPISTQGDLKRLNGHETLLREPSE